MSKKVYFNPAQLKVMYTQANTDMFLGGRRLGKSHGIAAPFCLRNTQHLPGSSGGIVGTSYQQLLTRTLPGTLQALNSWGYKRDVHYYVCRKPPEAANFKKPLIEPSSYDNSIIFYNGTIWRLISQDRPGSSNSLTLDWALFDEAKFLNYEKLKDETFPAIGGFAPQFKSSPFYRSKQFISDMPSGQRGQWMFKYKENYDPELINLIQALVCDRYKLEQKMNNLGIFSWKDYPRYEKTLWKEIYRDLARLRSVATNYTECSTIENVALLGEKYIRDLKRELPPLIFATSIMSKRIIKTMGGFYVNLSSDNYYSSYNYSHIDSLDLLNNPQEMDCRQDGDLDPNQPISIGCDYNANINWIVAGQKEGIQLKVLKSFFVKYERKLEELVQDFCKYYKYHKTKEVVFYFDSTAINNNYALHGDDFANGIISEYKKNGWTVHTKYIGKQARHQEKYIFINKSLKGVGDALIPMINKEHNEALILALEIAGVKTGYRGFEKDKSGEKLAESDDNLLEFRTDATDAFDTLLIGMNKFPFTSTDYVSIT